MTQNQFCQNWQIYSDLSPGFPLMLQLKLHLQGQLDICKQLSLMGLYDAYILYILVHVMSD